MKKTYVSPVFELEVFKLDASIASQCGSKVTLGPDYGEYNACKEFDFGINSSIGVMSAVTSFYDATDPKGGNVCSCYHTAGNEGYFTS